MKMKKYLSIAILLMLMATPLVFTSSYELVSEQSGVYLFSTTDKSTEISIMPVNKDFVYVNYDFISR